MNVENRCHSLDASMRGKELNDRETQLLTFALITLAEEIQTYWSQKEWRIDKYYKTWEAAKDPYDLKLTIMTNVSRAYNEKIIRKMKTILKSLGYSVIDNEKKFLQIRLTTKQPRKKHKLIPSAKAVLKKQQSKEKMLLNGIHSQISKTVGEKKCNRYDFTFDGFDPSLIVSYRNNVLLTGGFQIKPIRTSWIKETVIFDNDDSIMIYRPVTLLRLIASDMKCFSIRGKIKCLTKHYDQTIYFGG